MLEYSDNVNVISKRDRLIEKDRSTDIDVGLRL